MRVLRKPPSRLRRRAAQTLLVAALACGGLSCVEEGSGHERMIALLRALADDPEAPFFGDAALERLRAKRASLPRGAQLAAAQIGFSTLPIFIGVFSGQPKPRW